MTQNPPADVLIRALDPARASQIERHGVDRWPLDWRSRPALLRGLHHPDPAVRGLAARLLRRLAAEGESGPPSAVGQQVERVQRALIWQCEAHWTDRDVELAVERSLAHAGFGLDPPWYRKRGLRALMRRERWDAALTCVVRLRFRWPDGPWLLTRQLQILDALGRSAEALQLLVDWLGRNREDAERWAELGRRCEQAGRAGEARAAWQRVLDLRPDDRGARAMRDRLGRSAWRPAGPIKPPPAPGRRYYGFEEVCERLDMGPDELRRLVSEGEIRAFMLDDRMVFPLADIEALLKGRRTEATIILPSGGGDEGDLDDESSEVLLVEDDTSETLLDIDELDDDDDSRPSSVPEVDFGLADTGAETLTEELVFDDEAADVFDAVAEAPPEPAAEPIERRDERPGAPPPPAAPAPCEAPKKRKAAAPPATARRARAGRGAVRASGPPPAAAPAQPLEGFAELLQPPVAEPEPAKPRARPIPATRPWFERALGEDAGRPGPLERLAARSRLILRSLQATIGLRFILIAGAADALVDATVGYVMGVWRVWRRGLSVRRMLARKASGTQRAALEAELADVRRDLSRLLRLPGFRPEDGLAIADGHPSLRDATDVRPSFALELTLRTRHRLDSMRDDLDLLSAQQVERLVKTGLADVLKGMLPNPFEALTAWKDLLLLGLLMRYPRREVERMYAELIVAYHDLLAALDASMEAREPSPLALADHERAMLGRLDMATNGAVAAHRLNASIDRCRPTLRRMTWLLTSPGRMIDARRWPRTCLLDELAAAESQEGVRAVGAELALEDWLHRRVARRVPADLDERERRLAESRERRRRRRLERRLSAMFV